MTLLQAQVKELQQTFEIITLLQSLKSKTLCLPTCCLKDSLLQGIDSLLNSKLELTQAKDEVGSYVNKNRSSKELKRDNKPIHSNAPGNPTTDDDIPF